MGRSECGKTTLRQALKGDTIQYHKTQYINHYDVVIDTPGEYAETNRLGRALALYSYEADVVGMLISAREPYSLYPPCCTAMCNREVIGIVTKINHPDANVGSPEAEEVFKDLTVAYDILMDKEKKRKYDILKKDRKTIERRVINIKEKSLIKKRKDVNKK